MRELSQRIIAKMSGPVWEQLRGQFMQIARLLLDASPDANNEPLNSYIKFTINSDLNSPVYAAVWLKDSKRLIVGLALPEGYDAQELGPALPKTIYKGLNKYFVVERGGVVPNDLAEWAKRAYQNRSSAEPWATVAGFTVTGLMDRLAMKQRQVPRLLRRAA